MPAEESAFALIFAVVACTALSAQAGGGGAGGPPCTLTCPPGSPLEPEPCGSDINGGCASGPHFFDAACGDTWCGTTWATGGTRDTDWYLVDLDGGTISATLESEIPCVCFIVDMGFPGCNPMVVGQTGCSDDCAPIAGASASLPPGQYVVFVAPGNCDGTGIFAGFPCGGSSGSDYQVSISCPLSCFQVIEQSTQCQGASGTFNFHVVGVNACTSGQMTFDFTGSGGDVGQPMCFTVSLDDSNGNPCCQGTLCTTVPDCQPSSLPCDLDGDQALGVADLVLLLSTWGSQPDGPPDFDGDGSVGVADFLYLLANWGPCP